MLVQAPFFQNYVKNVIAFDGHENHDAESRKKLHLQDGAVIF